MNIEDIKIGEIYYTPAEVIGISHLGKPRVKVMNLIDVYCSPDKLYPIPKYDPCRKFRKGDKVHMKPEVNGRPVYIGEDAWEPLDHNEIWTVVEDELETGWVRIKTACVHATVWHAMLELVTPVEELEPYSVGESTNYFSVDKDDEELSLYWKDKHPNAKVAAEAECARLNEEYRKEQK